MAKKSFNTNNLVIICEGTETEQPYFEFLANKVQYRFDGIKVIPSPKDKLAADEMRANINRGLRKLASEKKEKAKKAPLYILHIENEPNIDANYNKYKHAPAKYVREAYLWMKIDGYSEAWAIYDLDDTDDPEHLAHECAKDLINDTPSLYKAFSAYSFEEWLLLNFERCDTAFRNSAYRKSKKVDCECRGRLCQHKNNCEAECIGDYLIRKGYANYIHAKYSNEDSKKKDDQYSKNDGMYYARAIFEDKNLRHRAYVNAAWTRSIKNDVFYDCNPYSDVDQLIMRLIGDKKEIRWIKTSESFTLGAHSFTIEQNNGSLYISHQGYETCILNRNQIFWCDDDYTKKAEAISGVNINYTEEENDAKSLMISDNCNVLCIKNDSQEFYFEHLR